MKEIVSHQELGPEEMHCNHEFVGGGALDGATFTAVNAKDEDGKVFHLYTTNLNEGYYIDAFIPVAMKDHPDVMHNMT
jgi:hypothetical protein